MNHVFLNSYPHHYLPTFLLIEPSNYKYKVGEEYYFVEWFNKEFLFKKYLVSKKTLPFSEITDEHTYLAKNCDSKLFFQILRTQFKTRLTQYKLDLLPTDIRQNYKVGSLYSFIEKETPMDVLIFTNKECIRQVIKRDIKSNIHSYGDLSIKSLMSKKPLMLKGYCHESKWNKELQRPYTEEELLELEKKGLLRITDKCVVWLKDN